MRRILVFAGVALLLSFTTAQGAMAAPAGASHSLIGTATESSIVQKVHRCHDGVRRDRGGKHRHVGRNCRRIDRGGHRNRGKRYWHHGARCDTHCVGVGPLRVCERDCD